MIQLSRKRKGTTVVTSIIAHFDVHLPRWACWTFAGIVRATQELPGSFRTFGELSKDPRKLDFNVFRSTAVLNIASRSTITLKLIKAEVQFLFYTSTSNYTNGRI